MGFDQYKKETEQNTAGNTITEEYKRLNELRYDQKENTEITIKFIKPSFVKRFEFWKQPSELDHNGAPITNNYCIVLKNDTGYNHFASLLGNPKEWNPVKEKVLWGKHTGGLYEFEYSDEKDPQTGFKKRNYKYLYKPEYRLFFQKFAFGGAPYEIGDLPITPSLRYHAAVFISGDTIMEELRTLRWVSLSHKLFLQLVHFDNNNFNLDDFWFKLKKQGSGKATSYFLTPDNSATDKLNKIYNLSDYSIPNLEITTQLSSDFYLWKYFKSDFIEGDSIIGTNYAELVEKGYNEYLEKNPNSNIETRAQQNKVISIPNVVREVNHSSVGTNNQLGNISTGWQTTKTAQGVSSIQTGAPLSSLSDEEIPF
ncbi:MAG: hypothetical protein ABIK31_03900 [candidate division WOR-3 bacterium]